MIDCCRFDCAYARKQIEQELMEERKMMNKYHVYKENKIEAPKTCPSNVTSTTISTTMSQDSILDMDSFIVVDAVDSSF